MQGARCLSSSRRRTKSKNARCRPPCRRGAGNDRRACQARISTDELDQICHDYIVDVQQAVPAPSTTGVSRNRSAPRSTTRSATGSLGNKVLKDGDIVNIDVTVIKNGFTATPVRCSSSAGARSRRAPGRRDAKAMWKGIELVKPGPALATSAMRSRSSSRAMVIRWCRNTAATDRAGFHEDPRCCTTANRTPASCCSLA